MSCLVKVYLLNDHFSPEYADAQHNGQESENNRRFLWEDEFAITTTVQDIELVEDTNYALKGVRGNQEEFCYSVPNMLLFRIKCGSSTIEVGASHVLIERHEIKRDDQFEIILYLKGEEPLSNPITGIYIAAADFPKELISHVGSD